MIKRLLQDQKRLKKGWFGDCRAIKKKAVRIIQAKSSHNFTRSGRGNLI